MTAIYTQVFVGGITALVCSAFGCYVGIKVALTEIRGELNLRKVEIQNTVSHLDDAQREFRESRKDHEDRIRMVEARLAEIKIHYAPEKS